MADSDSESEFEDNESKSAISKKNKPGAWIEEDENSIVDFTDPSVISKITGEGLLFTVRYTAVTAIKQTITSQHYNLS